MVTKAIKVLMALLCVLVGLYPILYFIGVLKPANSSSDIVWKTGFYIHIAGGSGALLLGWLQFMESLRTRQLKLHRRIGQMYVAMGLASGLSGLYIAFSAKGGWISGLGFACLAVVWLSTTTAGFLSARAGRIDRHCTWMILSYAACFSAVTLRIWLPILILLLGDFIFAYRLVAWLCWIPNLLVAIWILWRSRRPTAAIPDAPGELGHSPI